VRLPARDRGINTTLTQKAMHHPEIKTLGLNPKPHALILPTGAASFKEERDPGEETESRGAGGGRASFLARA
jgi:hypothetical protein